MHVFFHPVGYIRTGYRACNVRHRLNHGHHKIQTDDDTDTFYRDTDLRKQHVCRNGYTIYPGEIFSFSLHVCMVIGITALLDATANPDTMIWQICLRNQTGEVRPSSITSIKSIRMTTRSQKQTCPIHPATWWNSLASIFMTMDAVEQNIHTGINFTIMSTAF